MYEEQQHGRILSRRSRKGAPGDHFLGQGDEYERPVESHPLDAPEKEMLHRRLMGHYYRELDRQGPQRLQMERDEAFYDHEQWTAEEIATLEARGQAALVFNVIHTTVNWVLGTQMTTPLDYKILPRRKEGLAQAERKSQILKYLADVNDSSMHVSQAFAEQVKAGLGWLECGAQADDDGEPIYDRAESWRNMVWDSTASELDLSDGRYLFRVKWVDVDTAKAYFPGRGGMIDAAAESVLPYMRGGFDSAGDSAMDSHEEEAMQGGLAWGVAGDHAERPRVRLIECWYRQHARGEFVAGGDFRGEIYDPESRGHRAEVEAGRANIVSRVKSRMHLAIMTTSGLLHQGPSPYRHNRFPFTPLWGYRRAKDKMPYGLIRGLTGPQQDLNKRASKSLHILSSAKVFTEKGAVDDVEILRDEAARPDGVIEYNSGHQPPAIVTDTNLAAAHADLMSRDIAMIQQVSGVTDENMGRTTNATSGRAIMARQSQGQMTTSLFFTNLTFARRKHGEKQLTLIEQYMPDERQFRITNARGNPEYINVNSADPDADDDITATKADFVVSEEDQRATLRQAQAESLLELLSQLAATAPQVVMGVLDLLIEAMDIPQRDEFVKRIRQLTGATDPDADPNNPDPETQAIQAAKDKAAMDADRMAQAEISEKEGKAAEAQAKAKKTMAEAMKAAGDGPEAVQAQLDLLRSAVETAVQAVGAQEVAAVADQFLGEAVRRAAMQGGAPAMPPMIEAQPEEPLMPEGASYG